LVNIVWKLIDLQKETRRVFIIHRLDAKDRNGETLTWAQKSVMKKARASKHLKEAFPLLKRCQQNWGALWFLQVRTKNHITTLDSDDEESSEGKG